jgi:ADP-ribosylglycohydrolase
MNTLIKRDDIFAYLIHSLSNALIGLSIGDSVGAGCEMRSREWLLKNFTTISSEFLGRDPKFSQGFTPGDYTDDFEMSIGVLFALQQNNGILTTENLYNAFYRLYNETVEKFGVERAGYGSISKILNIKKEKGDEAFRAALLESMLTQKKSINGNDAPGNATLMRAAPIIFFPHNHIQNAIINALSTRPHGYTIFSSVFLVLAGVRLQMNMSDPQRLISDTLQDFESHRKYILDFVKDHRESVLYSLSHDKQEHYEFLDLSQLPLQFDHMCQKLKVVDQLPEPRDPNTIYTSGNLEKFNLSDEKFGQQGVLDAIDNIDYHTLCYPYASPLKGGTGLGAKADNTLYCAMFCLKWNRNTTLWGNILRVLMFGGDVDTLGACVLPYIYEWHTENNRNDVPIWIYNGMEMYNPSHKVYGFDEVVFDELSKGTYAIQNQKNDVSESNSHRFLHSSTFWMYASGCALLALYYGFVN